MAQQMAEVWLTSVVNDDLVDNAMVLAESLRRTKTSRTIAAILSRSLSAEKRIALNKVFDAIFYMDDAHLLEEICKVENKELRAKIFVFSLHFFQKCVYISPNSLVLENMDILFDDNVELRTIIDAEEGSIDFSLFILSPCRGMWERLWKSISLNGDVLTENYLIQWLKYEECRMKLSTIPDEVFTKVSVKSGTFLKNLTHAPIILFKNVTNGKRFKEQIESIRNVNFGILEKLITSRWMEIYGDMLNLIKNPIDVRCLKSLSNKVYSYENEPIAIVGMSCRYPGANNVEEFWKLLYNGEESIREPPGFRWTKEHSLRVTQQDRKTKAGFLSTPVDGFDARFFGLSPKEATYVDPQARLLHEVFWESLEDSGIDPLGLNGLHTGIFTGSWMNDYKDIVENSTERDFFRTYMGNSIGAAAARLSFLLGLTGPSIATESGSSSAIVALHLAVKSLRSREINLALAGGVNLLLHPFTSNVRDYIAAPNGRCKTLDSKAGGIGRAEGCGILVLKRLRDALRDRDNIRALIRGSGVSHEGQNRSLGDPTIHCKALAMKLALKDANVKPGQVSFVETHGTGTLNGDQMEVAAMAKAYYSLDRKEPLIIGSVKTNLGHTEACSGITGIMKTVLAMQYELIPKHLNSETLNPEIFLNSIPATIPAKAIPWPQVSGQPRIAGVSSFGITGTDGHVIIEEPPQYELPKFTLGLKRPTHILKISGKSGEALDEMLTDYENLFAEKAKNGDDSFSNAAYSGNIGRANFNHRAFIIASNYQDAVKALRERLYYRGEMKDGETCKICFLFSGQGSQYQGMAKALYETSPVFRINFDSCDQILRMTYDLSICKVLWDSNVSSNELSRTIYSQIAIFCIEFCLFKLWNSWGIYPDYVLGHSLGEFAAAVAAGILDFENALKLVAERSRLIDSLPRGSMLVIKASKVEVENEMEAGQFDLDFAAVNSPEQTVVAGDTQTILAFLSFLKQKQLKAVVLEATHPFHSRFMDPMLRQYMNIAQNINYKKGNPNIHYISGMEGRVICDNAELNAEYWVRHTREPVNFVDACAALRNANIREFLEVGPQPVLSSFVMMNKEDEKITCLPSLRRGTDDWNTILTTLGKLYLLGYKVDWQGFDDAYIRKKISLPFHPFHRKSFWVECNNGNHTLIHPLLGYCLNNASNLTIFQNDISKNTLLYLKDNCIGNRRVFPGSLYVEMCLAAGYCVAYGLTEGMESPRRAMRIDNLKIDTSHYLQDGKNCRLQVIVDLPDSADCAKNIEQTQAFRVQVYHDNTRSDASSEWILHAYSMFVSVTSTKDIMKKWNSVNIQNVLTSVKPTSAAAIYNKLDDTGSKFGDHFHQIQPYLNIKGRNRNCNGFLAEIMLPADYGKYLIHPVIIDAVLKSSILMQNKNDETNMLDVSIRIGSLIFLNAFKIDDGIGENKCYVYLWKEYEKYHGFISDGNLIPNVYFSDIELLATKNRTTTG